MKNNRKAVKREESSTTSAAKKKVKSESGAATTKPVNSFFPDYQSMWREARNFHDPESLPQIVDVMCSSVDDFVKGGKPIDQTEMNMMFCSVLRLMVGPSPAADLGNHNNGFETRHCKTYQKKSVGYNLLPFNPRCPLTENPEDEHENALQSDSPVKLEFELPFFMLTRDDVDKLELKLPALRSRIQQDSERPTIHTKEHKFVDPQSLPEKGLCSMCHERGKMVVSFKCHSLCNVCTYSRVLRGFLCCPVVGCPTALNLAQLGSVYAFLRRSINEASKQLGSKPPAALPAVTVKQEKQ